MIPEAVIEVVSKGYEAKDLEIGPPFYLSQGVKDVIVFDPLTLLVLHVRKDSKHANGTHNMGESTQQWFVHIANPLEKSEQKKLNRKKGLVAAKPPPQS